MKKPAIGLALVLSVMLFGCVSVPNRGGNGISFVSASSGLLEISNNTNFDLVIFAGKVEYGNVLGGIKSGQTRLFDYKAFLSAKNGAFLCRAVKIEDYNANNGHVSEDDVIFAKMVPYGNGKKTAIKLIPQIGGDGCVWIENSNPYVCELRVNSPYGEVLTTIPPYTMNQKVYFFHDSSGRALSIYPVFVTHDRAGSLVLLGDSSQEPQLLRFSGTSDVVQCLPLFKADHSQESMEDFIPLDLE